MPYFTGCEKKDENQDNETSLTNTILSESSNNDPYDNIHSNNPLPNNSTPVNSENTNNNENPGNQQETSENFGIIYPSSGQTISGNPITIYGVGLKRSKLSSFSVMVNTDKLYDQNGHLEGSGSDWSYSEVYLSGTEQYNNHTIKATAGYTDGTSDSATLEGIVRQ